MKRKRTRIQYVHIAIVPKGFKNAGDYLIMVRSTERPTNESGLMRMAEDARWLSGQAFLDDDEDDIHAIYEVPKGELLIAFRRGKRIKKSDVPPLRVPLSWGKPKNDHDPSRRRRLTRRRKA